jgi:hypothetical protein
MNQFSRLAEPLWRRFRIEGSDPQMTQMYADENCRPFSICVNLRPSADESVLALAESLWRSFRIERGRIRR